MAQQEPEMVRGTVASVIYQNYENGYAVLRLNAEDGSVVTVVGTIPLPVVGERLVVTGKWNNHASYGRQFEAEFLERLMPKTSFEILNYLSSRAIKGIGPKTAARIVDKFGENTLAVLDTEPERLAEIAGITPAKARAIAVEYRRQTGLRQLMEFFAVHGLPAELAVRTYRLYGPSAEEQIYDDPYLLTQDGLDAPFAAVDRFAVDLGVAADDPRRVESAIAYELTYNLTMGHAFLPEDKLTDATARLLSIEPDTVREALERMADTKQLVRDMLAGLKIAYLPELYEAETYTAQKLLALSHGRFSAPPGLQKRIDAAAAKSGVAYSNEQRKAIAAAVGGGVTLITGGPGTGKTTVLKGILALFGELGKKCLLAAPTGRAAKRLTEVTGEDASTIHRLLEAGIDEATGQMVFARDEGKPLKADVIIVDEMSMVDILLLSSLLRAIPQGRRLILVGDPDQLPPVGPGAPFGDMLRSETLPCVRLTEIFRQAQQSLIVMNAHRVNDGQMPDLRDTKSDFFFMRRQSEQTLLDTVRELCRTRLPKNMGISPEQIQVLSPTRKGVVGTGNLNAVLQAALNPPSPQKREHKRGDFTFREGDRVMQIRNNYDILWTKTDGSLVGAGIFNGDVGVIEHIDPSAQTLTVVYDDRRAEYDFTMLGELEPAYAITVHKSQGSEYRAVILVAFGGSPYLLTRSILYTALTRARELLIIVGREETVRTMVENAKKNRRYSGLKLRLQGASENSARADSERFFTDAKFGKSRNTGCISDFSNCGSGEKDPLLFRSRVFRGDLKEKCE